eukprot:gene12227-biopygen9472
MRWATWVTTLSELEQGHLVPILPRKCGFGAECASQSKHTAPKAPGDSAIRPTGTTGNPINTVKLRRRRRNPLKPDPPETMESPVGPDWGDRPGPTGGGGAPSPGGR